MRIAKILSLCCLCVSAAAGLHAQTMTPAQYIERYDDTAIAHMEKYGIPASIKMAQGMLESGYGNGTLARKANTHFNIKVKPSDNWRGEVVYHDDDEPGEAFRAYGNPEESWIDHSEYLDTQPRYQFLFELDPTDYKAWARGLKEAGYATDPSYADKLIKLIEDHRLYLLDRGENPLETTTESMQQDSPAAVAASGEIDVDNFTISMYNVGGRQVFTTDAGRTIVAREGDTLGSISQLVGVRPKRLSRLNRLDITTPLTAGQQIKIG